MSGMGGVFYSHGELVRERLERIHQALAPCGPDGHSLTVVGSIGFSHHWLATDSTVAPPQPFMLNGCSIVADARLDNQEELQKTLQLPGAEPSAAGLIARAYQRWGTDCLARLEGEFAFALWDGRARRLFCARDPMGHRPFYYRWDGKSFAWASSIKALVADPDYKAAPDEAMVGDYVVGWSDYPDRAATFFDQIRQVPAGHSLTLEGERVTVQRYWDIDPAEAQQLERPYEENVEEFGRLFRRSVERCLARAGGVGVLVSGGLDSTSIASVVEQSRKANGTRGSAPLYVSFYVNHPSGDERDYVRSFEEKYGCQAELVDANDYHLLGEVADAVDVSEEPYVDLNWTITRKWTRRFREKSCRVVLTGFGGDNIFTDLLDNCMDAWKLRGWRDGWRTVRRLSGSWGQPPWSLLWLVLREFVPPSFKAPLKRWLHRDLPPWVRRDFARRSGLLERVRGAPPVRGFPTPSQERDYRCLMSGRLSHQIGYWQRLGAANQLEFRHPFLDPALVRFALLAPPAHKIRDDEIKLLLRSSMQGILPELVRQRRTKGNQNPFIGEWVRNHEAQMWREFAKQIRLSSAYLEPGELGRLVDRVMGGGGGLLAQTWRLFTLELWLQRNFGRA